MSIAATVDKLSEEREAYILHARHELSILSSEIYDKLPGEADTFVREALLDVVTGIDGTLHRVLL